MPKKIELSELLEWQPTATLDGYSFFKKYQYYWCPYNPTSSKKKGECRKIRADVVKAYLYGKDIGRMEKDKNVND